MRQVVPAIALAALALAPLGCSPGTGSPTGATPSDAAPIGATPAAQNGSPGFTKLSKTDRASYASLAIAPDGTLHALFQELLAYPSDPHVFARDSQDGGATWSQPVDLSGPNTDLSPSTLKIIADGQGNAYAIWKRVGTPDEDGLTGGAEGGNLEVAVEQGGQWSPSYTVGTPGHVYSYFASVTPSGKPYLVWNEDIASHGLSGSVSTGHVLEAQLAPAGAQTPTDVLVSQYQQDTVGFGGSIDAYAGLHGYVDDDGTVHWLGIQHPAGGGDSRVVEGTGSQLSSLFKTAMFDATDVFMSAPPELVRDAQGQGHVLYVDSLSGPPALMDLPATGGQPTVVRRVAAQSGQILTFDTVSGPSGQLAALITLQDSNDPNAVRDLYVSKYANGAWGQAVNVSNNANFGSFSQTSFGGGDGGAAMATYNMMSAAGAFDTQGQLNMVFVDSKDAIASTNTIGQTSTFEPVNVIYTGGSSYPDVYFTKL